MNPHTAIGVLLHDLPTAATATCLALFPIVNPLGGVPMFFSLLHMFREANQNRPKAIWLLVRRGRDAFASVLLVCGFYSCGHLQRISTRRDDAN